MESIVHEAVSGTIVVSGLWGSGKTTLAMTLERPGLAVMWDLDQKSRARADSLGMEYYAPTFNAADPESYNLDDILKWVRERTEALPKKSVLIIDNGSLLEDAFHQAVARDPRRYRVNPGNVSSGKYGGTNPGVSRIWENLVGYVTGTLEYRAIVVCMHMSQTWAGGAPIDKYNTKGNKILTQLANLSLVLVRSPSPNTPPRGLVGKEALGMLKYDKGQFSTYMALPPAIPTCTWPEISRLIDEAPERTKFEPEETWTEKEKGRYGVWLSESQKELIMAVAKNPSFGVTEEDAGRAVAAGTPKFSGWEDVVSALVREKNYTEEEAQEKVRELHKGKGYGEVYDLVPEKD